MKLLLTITFSLFLYNVCTAQTGDMIVIKRKGVSVKTFMKGLYATFRTTGGEFINAQIYDLKNDSIYFKEIIVRQVPTQWGVSRMDTMATVYRGLHYTEIASVPKRKQSFSYLRNGTLLMIGGAGYVGLNVVNSAIVKYPLFSKENAPRLIGGAAAFAVGKLMQKLYKSEIKIGRKNTLHYLKLK
jgi:hypothetical protein